MIPDEAVEAAARAAAKDEDASNWDDEHQYYRNGWLNRMQVALEAATPHLVAQALEDAATALQDASSWSGSEPGPELIGRWPRSRAAVERRNAGEVAPHGDD